MDIIGFVVQNVRSKWTFRSFSSLLYVQNGHLIQFIVEWLHIYFFNSGLEIWRTKHSLQMKAPPRGNFPMNVHCTQKYLALSLQPGVQQVPLSWGGLCASELTLLMVWPLGTSLIKYWKSSLSGRLGNRERWGITSSESSSFPSISNFKASFTFATAFDTLSHSAVKCL